MGILGPLLEAPVGSALHPACSVAFVVGRSVSRHPPTGSSSPPWSCSHLLRALSPWSAMRHVCTYICMSICVCYVAGWDWGYFMLGETQGRSRHEGPQGPSASEVLPKGLVPGSRQGGMVSLNNPASPSSLSSCCPPHWLELCPALPSRDLESRLGRQEA